MNGIEAMPQTIHCCWFGGELSSLARRCLDSWQRYAPGWRVKRWDRWVENTLREDPAALPRFVVEAFNARKWAMVSDWTRMKALYEEGGLYVDFDVEFIAPLSNLPEGEWISGEWTAAGEVWMNPGGGICLRPKSPVAHAMLGEYENLVFSPKLKMMPWINSRLAVHAKGIKVLPPEIMSPVGMDGRCRTSPATVAIHHYAMGWASPREKFLQWLSWHGMRWLVDFALRVRSSWRKR